MSRQKILLAVVGLLVLLQGGDWVLTNFIEGPMQIRNSKGQQLEKRIKDRKAELARIRAEGKVLAVWESQSLPTNPDVARTLYRSWLLDLVAKSRLVDRDVTAGAPVNHRGLYRSITCTVRGRGTLNSVTDFMYRLYSAAHLHRVVSLALTPRSGSAQLNVSMSIEALILPTADRTDRLATGRVARLASATLKDYDPFVERNLFGFQSTGIDPAEYAYLTAVTVADGQPEAWFTFRNTDKVLKLRQGQELTVGQVSGTVAEILESEIVVQTGDERWLLAIGEKLTEAYALPPEY